MSSFAMLSGACSYFLGGDSNSQEGATLVRRALSDAFLYSRFGNENPPKPPPFPDLLKSNVPSPSFAPGDPDDLRTFTPFAAIRGNQVVVVGGALDTPALQTGALLIRESDCSLTQYAVRNPSGTASTILATLPDADEYLHKLTGLSTVPGVFAGGCQERVGTAAARGAYLGRVSNGDLLVALVADSGIQLPLRLARVSTQGGVLSTTQLAADVAPTIAAFDFNDDDIADIVTPYVSTGGQTGVGVYLSAPSGTFGPVTVYTGHAPAASKATATVSIDDVNADGYPDIVALGQEPFQTQPATLFTLLGNGSGAFSAGPSRTVPLTGPLVLGDFDGDDEPDALIAAGGSFLHGSGNGSFAAAQQRLTSFQPLRSLAAGDFNGDGDLDVAATTGANPPNRARFVTTFIGHGDGMFTAGSTYAAIRGAESVGVTDVNGDGNADIVVGIVQPGAITPIFRRPNDDPVHARAR